MTTTKNKKRERLLSVEDELLRDNYKDSKRTNTMFVKSLAKVLIGGGAVYVTLDQGIWSSSTHGSSALQRVRTNVLPDTSEYLNKVPTAKCINNAAVSSWNSGVEKTFNVVANSPELVCDYSHKTLKLIKDTLHNN